MRPDRRTLRLLRQDVRETLTFLRKRTARESALFELARCATPEDYFAFTHRYFVRGSAQNGSELTSFIRYAATISPQVVCEIGVQDGGTNFVLSRALPTVTTVLGIDLYVSLKCQLRFFRRTGVELHIIEGSSHAARTRRKVERALRSPIDVLLIDGDHSYQGALRDFAAYAPFVRSGGLIAFHDIVEDSFTRSGMKTDSYVGEIPMLWNRIRDRYTSHEFVERWDQDGRGIGVIVYDPSVDVRTRSAT